MVYGNQTTKFYGEYSERTRCKNRGDISRVKDLFTTVEDGEG